LVIKHYETENKQYLHYDSDLKSLENRLEYEYENSGWHDELIAQLQSALDLRKNVTAVHLGSSTGRISFELAKIFEYVIATDFCGLFIDTCLKLQEKCEFELKTIDKIIKVSLANEPHLKKVCFKQMTWIPNEIPICEFVLFSMIDRVMNQESN
jgi:hypothetical protein